MHINVNKYTIIIILVCILCFACAACAENKTMNYNTCVKGDIYAVFDEGIGWMTPSGALTTIKRVKDAGFNVYVPCVWKGRGTRYPSSVSPSEPNKKFVGSDPLARVIKIAHDNGIEVHPWFCVSVRSRDFFYNLYGPETPQKAFDLHRPEFHNLIVALIEDVVTRYDVDGINLDYVRTRGLCYCEYCNENYRNKYQKDIRLDWIQKNISLDSKNNILAWQNQNLENIISKINNKVKNINKKIIISVCGHPERKGVQNNYEGRDEISWMEKGLIDIIFNMDYSKVPDYEKNKQIFGELKSNGKVFMLLGNYDRECGKCPVFPRSSEVMSTLIGSINKSGTTSYGIYIYSMLSDEQVLYFHKINKSLQ